MSDPLKKLNGPVQKWLNQFADRVDYSRFTRGLTLFDQKRIRSFHMYPNHFVCHVRGVQDTYEVIGTFKLNGDLPSLEAYSVTCSCPDDAFICKHSVCATLHCILTRFEQADNEYGEQDQSPIARNELIERPLQRLQENLEGSGVSLTSLSRENSAPVLNTGVVACEMHKRVLEIIGEPVTKTQP